MPERYRLRHVDPNTLLNHPLNAKIYGTTVDTEFVADVKRRGVVEPLIATLENILIAGHKRRQAAIICEQKTVPVLYDAELQDEDDIREALILSNRTTRERTTEQKAIEFKILMEIEQARAANRKKAGKKQTADLREQDPQGGGDDVGRAADIAAKKAGLGSGKHAKKAAAVVDEIDRLRDAGKNEEADDLAETLNKKSVAKAAKKAAAKKKDAAGRPDASSGDGRRNGTVDRFGAATPEPTVDAFRFAESKELHDAFAALRAAKAAINALPEGAGTELIDRQRITTDIDNARRSLRFAMPYCVCPYCCGPKATAKKGQKCSACGGRKWITEAVYSAAPAEMIPENSAKKRT